MSVLRKYIEIARDANVPSSTSQHVMSLIEDNSLFPLFNSADLQASALDLSAAGLVPDSPSKFAFLKKASGGFLANSQALTEEPLFSLFLSGGISGLDESLLAGIVPDAAVPKVENNIPRQYMSIVPDVPSLDMNVVPQVMPTPVGLPGAPANNNNNNNKASNNRRGSDANARKRKFIQAPSMKTEGPEGQPLSPEEERNMKRQRRLVKNREAAQLFRQRQKAYIQDLEKKVQDLTVTNNEFRARVELLNSENKLIKEQLLYLRNFVTQAVSFSFPKVGNMPTTPGMPTVGGIPAGIASLALGNLASSPGLQGSMASMLSAVTGPLPGLLGTTPALPVNTPHGSSPATISVPSSSSTAAPHSHLPIIPTINIVPTPSSTAQPSQQVVPQRPLSPVINIDPTLSPSRTSTSTTAASSTSPQRAPVSPVPTVSSPIPPTPTTPTSTAGAAKN